MAEVTIAGVYLRSTLKSTPLLPQHISSFLALVEVGLVSLGPTFAVAKCVKLTGLQTKVVFDL
jgi:hypothetical protein